LAAGCGNGADSAIESTRQSSSTAPASAGPGAAIGPGISIAQARTSTLKGPMLVVGYLVARSDHRPRLCTSLGNTSSRRCGNPSMAIRGLTNAAIRARATASADGTRWNPEPIQLLGTVTDGTIHVSSTARA
jgi:hypothetical protein